jgi:hypothetical protein
MYCKPRANVDRRIKHHGITIEWRVPFDLWRPAVHATLLLAVVLPNLAVAQERTISFDQALRLIMATSTTNFRKVHGAKIENRKGDYYFEAALYLPEATYCRIFRQSEYIYCCEWRPKSKAELEPLYESIVGRVERALGSAWLKSSQTGKLRKDTVFHAEGKPLVQVILQPAQSEVYVLVLKPGWPKEGFTENVSSTENFLLR